jgi:hypothetical protein
LVLDDASAALEQIVQLRFFAGLPCHQQRIDLQHLEPGELEVLGELRAPVCRCRDLLGSGVADELEYRISGHHLLGIKFWGTRGALGYSRGSISWFTPIAALRTGA